MIGRESNKKSEIETEIRSPCFHSKSCRTSFASFVALRMRTVLFNTIHEEEEKTAIAKLVSWARKVFS